MAAVIKNAILNKSRKSSSHQPHNNKHHSEDIDLEKGLSKLHHLHSAATLVSATVASKGSSPSSTTVTTHEKKAPHESIIQKIRHAKYTDRILQWNVPSDRTGLDEDTFDHELDPRSCWGCTVYFVSYVAFLSIIGIVVLAVFVIVLYCVRALRSLF
jgi:hypothetical protein